jgi:hypothetical protein
MDWLAQIDAYCERLGPGLWAEPVNAVTNAAFLIAAAVVWRRTTGQGHARLLAVILALIGFGSFAFHTAATRIAALADVLPIAAFILVYIHAATRQMLGLGPVAALAVTAAALPLIAGGAALFGQIDWLGSSAGYAPVPVLILVYAALTARRAPATARGLAQGAGLLIVSLTFRTLDGPLCGSIPLGTHFLWHILNAVMLGHMIAVLVRHRQMHGDLRAGG